MEKPNILFIVIDSTIKDFYDHQDNSETVTPNINELAEEGMVFDDANAAGVWTPASHGAIFSGKYPSRTNSTLPNLDLDEQNTLASKLSENGYSTSAVVTAGHITRESGYDIGFDEYTLTYKDIDRTKLDISVWKDTLIDRIWGRRNRTVLTTELMKERIEELDKPWYLFCNYSTAHRPYRPPFYLRKKYEAAVGNKQKMKEMVESDGAGAVEKIFEDYEITGEDFKLLKSWFKAELCRADKHVGKVIDKLKEEEEFENTIVVVTSDHGDEFGEHNLFGHHALYETILNVPLVIRGPAIPKGRSDKPVSLLDLMPTLLDLTDSEIPKDLDGGKIFPLNDFDRKKVIAESGKRGEGPQGAEFDIYKKISPPSKSIKKSKYKLIHRKGPEDELYNLEKDPEEQNNIAGEKEDLVKELKEELPKFKEYDNEDKNPLESDDEEIKKRLEELGYK